MAKLELLVIHCTATPENKEISGATIRQWHTAPVPQGRGWKQVGYADVIHLNGQVENLVPYDNDEEVEPWEVTNGATGINSKARHVVYVGGCDTDMKPKDTRTRDQLIAMANYVRQTISAHPNIKVAGHRHFAAKACPSFEPREWLAAIGIPAKNIY